MNKINIIFRREFRTLFTFFIILVLLTSCVQDEVLSQWKGPNRDGKFPDTNLLAEWPEEGLEYLWIDTIGMGHSSPAVTEDAVYITGMPDSTAGILYCFNLEGKLKWKDKYGRDWDKQYYLGSRSTPTVVGNKLYFLSGWGAVYCYNTKLGEKLWTKDFFEDFKSDTLFYGFSESVLIVEDLLICTPGSKEFNVIALNRHTGDLVWKCKGNGDLPTYSSPILVNHNGTKLIISQTKESILGIDALSGELYWRIHQAPYGGIHANTPVYENGRLFISSAGKEEPSGLVAIDLSEDGTKAEVVWRRQDITNVMAGLIIQDEKIYTSIYRKGKWYCIDAKTGETISEWTDFNEGAVIFADNHFYIISVSEGLILAKASNNKLEAISMFKPAYRQRQPWALPWAFPVIKDGRLYFRYKSALMVFDIGA